MAITWKAPQNVQDILARVKQNHPNLAMAKIVIAFTDTKPFVKNKFNWGSVSKFSDLNKLWHGTKVDYCIILCSDVWHSILDDDQKEALIDLHLCRCAPELEPEKVTEGKKTIVVKDEHGRIKYTDKLKTDDNGNPKWTLSPLDLLAFIDNVKRYGIWCDEISDFKHAIENSDENIELAENQELENGEEDEE